MPRSRCRFLTYRKELCATLWLQWLWNCYPWNVPSILHDCNSWKRMVSFAWPASQIFVFYATAKKRASEKTIQMENVIIRACSIFIGHGHLRHAGAGWYGSPCLRSHVNFFLSFIFWRWHFFRVRGFFPISLVHLILLRRKMMTLKLRVIALCNISNIV